jgi:hypothetical protein
MDTVKHFPDGVTFWDKQEDIHKNAHFNGADVHGGPAFVPWHRVIVNRLEQLLREVDPALSLHYWNWTSDPRSAAGGRAVLFSPEFMGNANGDAGHLLNNFESSEDAETGNGHAKVWRNVGASDANPDGTPAIAADASFMVPGLDFQGFAAALTQAHNSVAHDYIGGTIVQPHYSFHDPFVFLLHSNLDRLWAQWQTDPSRPDRLVPSTAYAGLTAAQITALATENVEPWAGGTGLDPWASDPTKRAVITYTDISVVTPPCYDTNGSSFQVLEAENPLDTATSRYQVTFNDVPEEETTWRAAVIRVRACGDVTIRVKPGTEPSAPFAVSTPFVIAKPGPVPFREIRIWFEFTAGALGTAPQTLGAANTTLQCDENGQEFQFELRANTIKRPTVAVQLALDQSGSMADPAGTSGATRLQVLVDASDLFANLIQKNNGIGIIRFDQDAYPPNDPTYGGMAIAKVTTDGFGDPTRLVAKGVIGAHGTHGATSVGDGLEMARIQLGALPPGSYDNKAIILLTDGLENRPKSINEVSPTVDSRTFAVGLGNEMQVNTAALSALAGSTGGSLLLSGQLATSLDDQFRLRKFFLQILASVTNTAIVKDPVGYVNLGTQIRIPFQLSEADINCRVILLTDFPVVNLAVESPEGDVIDEGNAAAFGAEFETATNLKTSSFTLPVAFQNSKVHAGTWYARLEVDPNMLKKVLDADSERTHEADRKALAGLVSKGAKYCMTMHSFSNLRMSATVSQSGFVPGSTLFLRAVLTEYSVPVAHRARITADIEYPDHSLGLIHLAEEEPGVFAASLVAKAAGIYRIRIIAEGGTFRGVAFTRELLATAAVWNGGDRPDQPPRDDEQICELIECLVSEETVGRFLKAHKIDPSAILRCVRRFCGARHA